VTVTTLISCTEQDAPPPSASTTTSMPGLPSSAPRETPASTTVRATPSTATPRDREPVFYRYEVRDGDTIEGVARQFILAPASVRDNNPQFTDGPLTAGTLLVLPSRDGILHRIALGETLTEIAARYHVAPRAIIEFPGNGLTDPARLPPDGMILVPGGRLN
jgi:LysM repeat protein